jgi:hypothetical protein
MLPFKEFRKQSFSHHLRNSCHTGGILFDREGADSPRFWDKADHLMVVTVGGAALGGSIAGVYGAVIGAILAAGCGWYITFRKAK